MAKSSSTLMIGLFLITGLVLTNSQIGSGSGFLYGNRCSVSGTVPPGYAFGPCYEAAPGYTVDPLSMLPTTYCAPGSYLAYLIGSCWTEAISAYHCLSAHSVLKWQYGFTCTVCMPGYTVGSPTTPFNIEGQTYTAQYNGLQGCTQCPNNDCTCPSGELMAWGTCVTTCPSGTWANYNDGNCDPCPAACNTCTSNSTCQVCTQYFTPFNGLCVTSCPPGAVSFNGTFLSSCPSNTYATSGSNGCEVSCASCPTTCASCTSASTCTSCNAGYILSGSSCIAAPICSNGCTTCTSSTVCTACNSPPYLLFAGTCVTNCPTGFGADPTGAVCVSCPTKCASCTSVSTCTSCNAGYTLSGSSCIVAPVTPNCSTGCATCTSPTVCTACKSPAYLLPNTNTCVTNCPPGYVANPSGTQCVACPTNCAYCVSGFVCTACDLGYILLAHGYVTHINAYQCVTSCPAGYALGFYTNPITGADVFGSDGSDACIAIGTNNIGPNTAVANSTNSTPNTYITTGTASTDETMLDMKKSVLSNKVHSKRSALLHKNKKKQSVLSD